MAAMEIVLLGLMLAALAFGGFAVICVIGRRRRRQALRELLGDAFDEKKSFIQALRAITVDEAAGRFAFSDSRNTILYKANRSPSRIVDVRQRPERNLYAFGSYPRQS
jgi:hypothetical protein